MAVKMNFEQGIALVDQDCEKMFYKANGIITKSMTDECVNLLNEFPYEYLRKYLNTCFGKVAENLQNQIRTGCQQWADGEGGFEAFAKKTMNSTEAIQYAKQANDRVEKYIGECLSDLSIYVQNHMTTLRNPATNYDNVALQPKLTDLFSKPLAQFNEEKEHMTGEIRKQMEENRFMTPLLGVTEILFRTCAAWYQSMLQSVPSFIDNANTAIENASSASADSAAAAGTAADSVAEAMPTNVEL